MGVWRQTPMTLNFISIPLQTAFLDFSTYYNRGAAYYNKGNTGRAISDFQKACDMGNEYGCKTLEWALKSR
jgi:hypothetical protein